MNPELNSALTAPEDEPVTSGVRNALERLNDQTERLDKLSGILCDRLHGVTVDRPVAMAGDLKDSDGPVVSEHADTLDGFAMRLGAIGDRFDALLRNLDL